MCGIVGLFSFRSGEATAAQARELLAARDAMRVRGPDGAGLWWSDDHRVGLAHRRLAIIDLDERSLQPMHAGPLSLVYNGEIYNFRELSSELQRDHGFRPRTSGDSEIILAAYRAFGPAMVDHLRGMFAFAIWDGDRNELFAARDPYGIKPLYYAEHGGTFYFASQVKALLRFEAISREPDPAGMAGFEIFGSLPEPFTLYRAIRALPAGSRMTVTRDGAADPVRYAKVSEVLAAAERDDTTPVAEAVAAAVRDSVRAHLVADVEVGAFLSSGIDSGSLVGLMRDAGQTSIRAITLGFDELAGSGSDEVPLAREIAGRYGADHRVRRIGGDEFTASAERILDDMDQPSVDGVNTWFVSKAAHECGLKVVVSGLGGDELLAGYSTFSTVPRTRRFAGAATRLPFARRFARFALERFAGDWVRRNPKALGVLDHADTWAGAYLLRRAVMLPFELGQRLNPATAREGLERLRVEALIGDAIAPAPAGDLAKISALESSLYMRNQLLRDSDWASMAHSLELRVPFIDWPTLQRIAPVVHRLGGGAGKRALANSPSLPLPDACVRRPRTGFTIPVGHWIGKAAASGDRLASRHWSSRVSHAFGID